ncbi:MAG: bifunctional DNA-formamidopyrimidine glycosylase/DNA-(apurinic or apyrimidinic site) lyase [Phycisphaerales bacterium]|jgi:formamidopyrimidine-DNA glycosylase|nr:bifunctional DNA-formamidopyrimidine glycosylase/DNA-(apurinic or apyrimidinic site) lyase [Phycisphaerales bacterium]
MPELPEVETLRRSLEPALLGARVDRVLIFRRDVIVTSDDPPGGFSRQRTSHRPAPLELRTLLEGATIDALLRHGKEIAISTRDGRALRVHLGMTGQLRTRAHANTQRTTPDEPPAPHEHVRWTLRRAGERPVQLSFIDPRRFGGVWTSPTRDDLLARWAALGPDAVSITPSDLAKRLSRSRRPIKAALLDQGVLAGVGNIYADEALFIARIAPRRLASRLTPREINALADAIRQTLAQAIQARGSTLRDFADAEGNAGYAQLAHAVYGRGGEPCVRCGARLRSAVIAQRTTVWCPACQRSSEA